MSPFFSQRYLREIIETYQGNRLLIVFERVQFCSTISIFGIKSHSANSCKLILHYLKILQVSRQGSPGRDVSAVSAQYFVGNALKVLKLCKK